MAAGFSESSVCPEKRAALVYCDRMTADFNVGIVAGERQLQRIFVPADRANGVPHADEPRLANPRCKGAFEVVSEIEIAFFFGAAMTPLTAYGDGYASVIE